MSIQNQPINNMKWVEIDKLKANDYNPNYVAPPELQLLKISILTDGWTQPIVIRPDYEIVDGFHRWMVAKTEEEVRKLTGGKIPAVILKEVDREEQMMSTVRHNRARGTHQVLKMSELVRELIDEKEMSCEEVMDLLQMEYEEVDRLYDDSGMTERGSKEEFNNGWVPDANT